MIIRNARKTDINKILEIEKSSFDWFDVFPKSLFYQYLNEYSDDFFVVLDHSESVVGYAILVEKNGNGYLLSIAVHPKSRNKGIAAILIEFLENKCKEKGYKKLILEVRMNNNNAIKVYRKFGLKKVGIKLGYYGDGENALMMEKILDQLKND
ncbi:MAG: ribosomal protein S18-alanine N-acetyltransferase [Candidatus Bathyarchaeota archaeon]